MHAQPKLCHGRTPTAKIANVPRKTHNNTQQAHCIKLYIRTTTNTNLKTTTMARSDHNNRDDTRRNSRARSRSRGRVLVKRQRTRSTSSNNGNRASRTGDARPTGRTRRSTSTDSRLSTDDELRNHIRLQQRQLRSAPAQATNSRNGTRGQRVSFSNPDELDFSEFIRSANLDSLQAEAILDLHEIRTYARLKAHEEPLAAGLLSDLDRTTQRFLANVITYMETHPQPANQLLVNFPWQNFWALHPRPTLPRRGPDAPSCARRSSQSPNGTRRCNSSSRGRDDTYDNDSDDNYHSDYSYDSYSSYDGDDDDDDICTDDAVRAIDDRMPPDDTDIAGAIMKACKIAADPPSAMGARPKRSVVSIAQGMLPAVLCFRMYEGAWHFLNRDKVPPLTDDQIADLVEDVPNMPGLDARTIVHALTPKDELSSNIGDPDEYYAEKLRFEMSRKKNVTGWYKNLKKKCKGRGIWRKDHLEGIVGDMGGIYEPIFKCLVRAKLFLPGDAKLKVTRQCNSTNGC